MLLQSGLEIERKEKVSIITPKKGDKERMVELAHKNALMVLTKDTEKIKLEEKRTTGAMKEIADWLWTSCVKKGQRHMIYRIQAVWNR